MTDQEHLLQALNDALATIERLEERLEEQSKPPHLPAAIIGLACRFPGAPSASRFWQLLQQGTDAIGEIPTERWPADAHYDPEPGVAGKMVSKQGGFLDSVDGFDETLFDLSPRELRRMDPQHRLLLEVAYEAFEDAALPTDRLRNSRCGVFVGLSENDWANVIGFHAGAGQPDLHDATGAGYSFAAGRISYYFGLQGPNIAVDTACSSSLTAIHMALRSLQNGDCDLAIAGGVQLRLTPEATIALSRTGALAPDGRCKAFSAAANGFGRGEGCGLIVLQRLDEAQAGANRIRAVLQGSAMNHDGRSSGFTVPNEMAQIKLLRAALADARLPADAIGYIEAHGTGTRLGDPIEASALAEVFGQRDTDLFLGSVKSNLGHLEAGAGVAGVIKTVLVLEHAYLPPTLHAEEPNPLIDWKGGPLELVRQGRPWPAGAGEGGRRFGGVSSFSMSGSNAHVILGDAPPAAGPSSGEETRDAMLLTVSARTKPALSALCNAMADRLEASNEAEDEKAAKAEARDICYSGNTGRSAGQYRAALVTQKAEAFAPELRRIAKSDFATAEPLPGSVDSPCTVFTPTSSSAGSVGLVCFQFTGQGSQYGGMGDILYSGEPVFREVVDRCAHLMGDLSEGPDLRAVLGLGSGGDSAAVSLLERTEWTQPALFALEVGLARVWGRYGVEPDLVLGHSVGEFSAACVSGILSLEEAFLLVVRRGQLMGGEPAGGAMVSVSAPEAAVSALVSDWPGLAIAAANGPFETVVSGDAGALERLGPVLSERGWRSHRLAVSHAFHSPRMAGVAEPLRAVARTVEHGRARVDFVSGLDSAYDGGALTAEYWARQLVEPVRYGDALARARARGAEIFLEIGPKPVLSRLGRTVLPDAGLGWLASLREGAGWAPMLEAAAGLYVRGVELDFAGLHAAEAPARRKVPLPGYPFQRRPYWPNEAQDKDRERGRKPALDIRVTPVAGMGLSLASVELDRGQGSWLQDHKIGGQPVAPAALFLTLALAASSGKQPEGQRIVLRDLAFLRPLVMDTDGDGANRVVQAVVYPADAGSQGFQRLEITSRPADRMDEAGSVLHAVGELVLDSPEALRGVDNSADDVGSESPGITGERFYERLADAGIEMGPLFRLIARAGRMGEHGFARLVARADASSQPDRGVPVRPGLDCVQILDAAMQMLSLYQGDEDQAARLPFRIEGLDFGRGALTAAASISATRRMANQAGGVIDMEIHDDRGQGLVALIGVSDREVPGAEIGHSPSAPTDAAMPSCAMYRRAYAPVEMLSGPVHAPRGDEGWLILDTGGAGAGALFEHLQSAGVFAKLCSSAELEAWNPRERAEAAWSHMVLVAMQAPGAAGLDIEMGAPARMDGAEAFLAMIGAFAAGETAPRFGVLVSTADSIVPGELPLADQAALRALSETAAAEHPDMGFSCLDIGTEALSPGLAADVVRLFREGSNPSVLAWRRGHWMAPQMVPAELTSQTPDFDRRLQLTHYGGPDDVVTKRISRSPPGAGEVEIEVAAAGLNFRDVMISLGMLAEEYAQTLGYASARDVPLGFECAGVVTAIGPDVMGISLGDRVMAFAEGSFATHVVVAARYVAPVLKGWRLEEAAGVPMAFLTAQYALVERAGLKAGETVLIHAAAGGVGQAAIQIAKQIGARIIASASVGKWHLLHAEGIEHIVDSRTADFAGDIAAYTDGRGVNVVLNSLTGQFIDESFRVLAEGGRFIELGKRDVLTRQEVGVRHATARYEAFDLGDRAAMDEDLVPRLFSALLPAWFDGRLSALPTRLYPLANAADAYRCMQSASHIGKIVLGMKPYESVVRGDEVHIVTGGMGALGLAAARKLVDRGSRNLVLIGRNRPEHARQAEAIEALRRAGCDVHIATADIAEPGALDAILEQARCRGPIAGVIHAAGVLDDGMILNLDASRLRNTARAKLGGFLALHAALRNERLRFFVCYSSIAAVEPSPGQANYAAANAAMDALAVQRRALALPATTIWWGPWSGDGMSAGHDDRMARQGFAMISPEAGREALAQILRAVPDAVMVAARKADMVVSTAPPARPAPEIAEQPAWRDLPAKRRQAVVEDVVVQATASVMGLDHDWALEQLERTRPFSEIGIDSLMAVELSNSLQTSLKIQLPATVVFDHPTIQRLTRQILDKAAEQDAEDTAGTAEEAPVSDGVEDLRFLLDEELEHLDDGE